ESRPAVRPYLTESAATRTAQREIRALRAARAVRDAGDGPLRRDPAPGTEPQCPRGDCADRVARAAQRPPRASSGGTGLRVTVKIPHAAVVATGSRGTRYPRRSSHEASRA